QGHVAPGPDPDDIKWFILLQLPGKLGSRVDPVFGQGKHRAPICRGWVGALARHFPAAPDPQFAAQQRLARDGLIAMGLADLELMKDAMRVLLDSEDAELRAMALRAASETQYLGMGGLIAARLADESIGRVARQALQRLTFQDFAD